MSIYCTLFARK